MKLLGLSLLIAVLSSLMIACNGLNCYVCTSRNHTACKDPFNPKRAKAAGFEQSCPEPRDHDYRALCRKTHQTVRGEVRVIRACGFVNRTEACYRTRNAEVVVRSCQCFNNTCNAAEQARPAAAALLLLPLVAAWPAI